MKFSLAQKLEFESSNAEHESESYHQTFSRYAQRRSESKSSSSDQPGYPKLSSHS